MPKKKTRKFDSIQWVIDALDSPVIEKRTRENHKTDEIRADESLFWCPQCKRKWNIFEGEMWSSADIKLWDEKICLDCDFPVR